MVKHIPKILLYSRLFVVGTIVAFLFMPNPAKYRIWVVALMYYAIVSDIFDGIIARRFNISTENFRILDTLFDMAFYLSILAYAFAISPFTFHSNSVLIVAILCEEASMYAISLVRFRKAPSPHAILSKFWGVYLIIEFTLLLLNVEGSHFTIALFVGIAVHLDRVLIYSFLNKWDHDIPSSYHAWQLRKGKQIKRHSLFNG